MSKICVFCGSSPGARNEYVETAKQLGLALVKRNIGLVYGGAGVGIMGKLAEAVIAAGGKVIVCDYFRSLMDFLDRAVVEKFIRAEHRSMVLLDEDPNALLDQFERYEPPKIDKAKWILSLNET